MRRLLIAGLAVLLAGCGDAVPTGTGSTVIPPTATALPLATVAPPTAAPVALSDVDLAPLLVAEGDLPAAYKLDPPTTQLQSMYGQLGVPLADASLTQLFEDLPAVTGFATISLYGDRPMLSDAYTRLVQSFGTSAQSVGGLGDQANQTTAPIGQIKQRAIVFARCQAVVMVTVYGDTSAQTDAATGYAKAIDQRIQASPICE